MPNFIPISDIAAPELDVYARLSESQLKHYCEPNLGIFIAESPKVICRALDAGYTPLSLLLETGDFTAETQQLLSRCGDIPIYTANRTVLTQLTGFQLVRGALCAMQRKPLPSVEAVCRHASRIAVLEQVVNPTNVGAIIRSAAALHMDAVLLTHGSSDPLYRRAARVSMGTVFQIPWTFLPREGIAALKPLGFRTVAMALCEDTLSLDAPELAAAEKLAVVLGTEGEGLAASTITACDYTVCIPMSHGVDSLNVAAASAVAFYELGARRKGVTHD